MRQAAAVLCHDKPSLQTLQAALRQLGVEPMNCTSQQEALQLVVSGRCSTLIVDFDSAGAEEAIRMAALLPSTQKPTLLAVASRVWPGTGRAFQSGASRILYRPLDAEQIKAALSASALTAKNAPKAPLRKSARYELKTLVYLQLEHSTLPAITIDIGEHGLALQASEPVPMSSNVPFRCLLPGTDFTLHGHADVIWASEHGRAGLFFSQLAPDARKHLKLWLSRRAHHKDHAKDHGKDKNAVHELLPPANESVSFAISE
jgi:ActR/RegA family two-component response regulator